MAGTYYKHTDNVYYKAKSVYYKNTDNIWYRGKSLNYKPDSNWTNNLLEKLQVTYQYGNTYFIKEPTYSRLGATYNPASEIGVTLTQAVNLTGVTGVFVEFSKNYLNTDGQPFYFIVDTNYSGTSNNYIMRSVNTSSGITFTSTINTTTLNGNHYLRFHLYQAATNDNLSYQTVDLKRVYMVINNDTANPINLWVGGE